MTGIIDGLKDCADDILGIRDDIGAQLKLVYLVTRTWSGSEPGDGTATDAETQLLPTPHVVDYSHNVKIAEGGAFKQGDILLRGISKVAYPAQSSVDLSTEGAGIEKFYRVGELLYKVISIREKHLTWDIQLRKLSDQRRYV